VQRPRGPRRWVRPQALFTLEGTRPFKPLPVEQALPMLEWGLNYAVSSLAHDLLILHAAVVARGDRAVVLPGEPGAGKSTLAAALACRGWRLLSDELTLIRFDDRRVLPLARPINLKNASIPLLRAWSPDAVMSPVVHDTAKGTVALLRAPEESVRREKEPAEISWIVFPRWEKGARPALQPHSKASTVLDLARNGFNYEIHGRRGFDALADIVDRADCHAFTYGSLDDAVAAFDGLAAR
jgi:HprK-related kinase A